MSAEAGSYRPFTEGTLNSYSLVFFSTSRIFAWILLAVTFFDLQSGIAGLVSVLAANFVAWLAGLNTEKISKGYYGFNALLVGLGLGMFYAATPQFYLVLLSGALLTLFLTVTLEGVIGKYYLPYLSLPFLFAIWLALMATREFNYLEISQRGVYMLNEMYVLGGPFMVSIYEWFNRLELPQSLEVYFRSLGAIFFQYHLLPGLLIAVGLLVFSRIAFTLSLVGFYAAYVFYQVVGADMTTLSYTYIGFNFILTAIAIGGFFIIPSWYSYLWVLLLTPLTSILLTAFKMLFTGLQLSIYSLPFNIIVIMFLYVLKFRERHPEKPELVAIQHFSPEKNLYARLSNKGRFGNLPWFHTALPFWGEWTVTQAHDGKLTHKANWRHAWDFEITGSDGRTFKGAGNDPSDYHCFDKPVLAPADGWVEDVADGIDDNPVGEVNLEHNWGNTVVIRHGDHLFSALSHLKKGSVKVSRGDFVKKGEIIARCGSSGRSPVPHLHAQFQATPQIGSATLDMPFSHYIKRDGGQFRVAFSERPSEKDRVCNIEPDELLKEAYNFVPGRVISFRKETGSAEPALSASWEVKADVFNNTFLHCRQTGAKAFFVHQGDVFLFTHFEGNKRSLLYPFFLGNYKVLTGFYRNLALDDRFPPSLLAGRAALFFQDFIAPFAIFIRSSYLLEYVKSAEGAGSPEIMLRSQAYVDLPFSTGKKFNFELNFRHDRIDHFIIRENGKSPSKWVNVSNS